MTGPEHYRAAEKLIEVAEYAPATEAEGIMTDRVRYALAVAQVHATLALAAASAQNIRRNGAVDLDVDWANMIGGGS